MNNLKKKTTKKKKPHLNLILSLSKVPTSVPLNLLLELDVTPYSLRFASESLSPSLSLQLVQKHLRATVGLAGSQRLCIMDWTTAYWLLWDWNVSISVKEILILEIVLFSHYLHEPVLPLHFSLFLCLTPLSITRSSIFLELPKYSRHTVKLNLDDPSV